MNEQLDQTTLATLTAQIAAAYVAHNVVQPSDLPRLLSSIAQNLKQIGQVPEEAEPAKSDPAVSIRRSIQPDHLVCLICGKHQKMLKRHLAKHHAMTPDDYRSTFELKPDYPMVAPDYAAHRSTLAKKIGLGRRKPVETPVDKSAWTLRKKAAA